jgi:hypothetical protein
LKIDLLSFSQGFSFFQIVTSRKKISWPGESTQPPRLRRWPLVVGTCCWQQDSSTRKPVTEQTHRPGEDGRKTAGHPSGQAIHDKPMLASNEMKPFDQLRPLHLRQRPFIYLDHGPQYGVKSQRSCEHHQAEFSLEQPLAWGFAIILPE